MDRITFKSPYCPSRTFKIGLLIAILINVVPGFYPGAVFSGGVMKEGNTVILTKQDSGKEIEARVGDIIQIELQGMGGAGYRWHVQDMGTDCLKLISEETKVVSGGKVGAPVSGIWKFEVTREGPIEIRMDHYRPWEGIGRSTDHFSIRLNIR
jgi:predicted secreted protein